MLFLVTRNTLDPRKSRCTLHINVNFLILHHLCLIQSKNNACFNFLNFLQPYNYHYLNVLFYFSKKIMKKQVL